MKIRTQENKLIDMSEKEITTVKTPIGEHVILAHTKDKKDGCMIGKYSTETKAIRVLCAIQVAKNHPEKIRTFRMPQEGEV